MDIKFIDLCTDCWDSLSFLLYEYCMFRRNKEKVLSMEILFCGNARWRVASHVQFIWCCISCASCVGASDERGMVDQELRTVSGVNSHYIYTQYK